MKAISKILESIENGRVANVWFSDKSIYERADLCVGDIVSKIQVTSDVYKIGNKLEFSLDDVLEVKDAARGNILYQRQAENI